MPAVSKNEAMALLTEEIERLPADEVLEIHNELFPQRAFTVAQAQGKEALLVQQVIDHIKSRQGIDEITALWGLVFTTHRNIHYDDEDDRIHYNEDLEPQTLQ
jgi:hypothetical protein